MWPLNRQLIETLLRDKLEKIEIPENYFTTGSIISQWVVTANITEMKSMFAFYLLKKALSNVYKVC